MRRNWQQVPKIKKTQWRNGYRDITIYSVNLGVRVRVFPFLPDGTLDPEAVVEIEKAFADKHTKATVAVHPRLIRLLYKLAVRFDAQQVNLISGYRESAEDSESHHGNGTAMDIMIPGVSLPALAKAARRLGHVGVGFYPVSGFIHVDVREKSSYFWVDPSGPGKRSCIRQIMPDAGHKFDRRWKPSDDEPIQKTDKKGVPINPDNVTSDVKSGPVVSPNPKND
ncbi:MAG: YcbK family protein [Deltaproteobacteria bacterium]|nr:YcbK family protein [Deltaproteobacteria bacterium]